MDNRPIYSWWSLLFWYMWCHLWTFIFMWNVCHFVSIYGLVTRYTFGYNWTWKIETATATSNTSLKTIRICSTLLKASKIMGLYSVRLLQSSSVLEIYINSCWNLVMDFLSAVVRKNSLFLSCNKHWIFHFYVKTPMIYEDGNFYGRYTFRILFWISH